MGDLAADNAAFARELEAELEDHPEERGDGKEALIWFAAGCAKIPEGDLAQYGETGYLEGGEALHGHLRVRQAMGYPPDRLDELPPDAPAPDFDDDFGPEFDDPASHEMTLQFWPRDELARAREVWQERVDEDAEFSEQESMNRLMSARGITRIRMVPLPVTGLTELASATGTEPSDMDTIDAYLNRVLHLIRYALKVPLAASDSLKATFRACGTRRGRTDARRAGARRAAGHIVRLSRSASTRANRGGSLSSPPSPSSAMP